MTDRYQKLDVAEKIADQVAKFPDGLAGPLLGILGRERPDIFAYYPELDQKIRELLQQELVENGYSHVQVISVDREENSSDAYPYVYQLLPDGEDPMWGKKYLPNVQTALHRRLTTSTEFDHLLRIGTVFIKLRLHNHMSVQKAKKWLYNEN